MISDRLRQAVKLADRYPDQFSPHASVTITPTGRVQISNTDDHTGRWLADLVNLIDVDDTSITTRGDRARAEIWGTWDGVDVHVTGYAPAPAEVECTCNCRATLADLLPETTHDI